MNEITVTATKWKLGWELELEDGGITQVRNLTDATVQVREYLDTVDPDVDHSSWSVNIVPQIGPALSEALAAKADTEAAKIATQQAARRLRTAVRDLRQAGLSSSNTATVLGITKGRVSQLISR